MSQYKIKWKKGDLISLGKAISNFNKKIRKLQNEENRLYLPNEINFQEAKENIYTRQELNRLINSLRRFQRQGAENLYITSSGEEMTKWERKELGIQARIAQRKLNTEIKKLNEPANLGKMGNEHIREIQANINRLKGIEFKKGQEFRDLKRSIQIRGKSDYSYKKALTYMQNYLNELEKYSHLENYDKLMKELEKHKNPFSFYEFMSKNENTKDLYYQSDNYYTQQAFNSYLQDLGIEIDNDSVTYETQQNNYKYRLEVNGKVISQSDNKSLLEKQALEIKGTTQIQIFEN